MSAVNISYWLGKTIYISVTNRACGLSLLASRGPSFAMPEASGFRPLTPCKFKGKMPLH